MIGGLVIALAVFLSGRSSDPFSGTTGDSGSPVTATVTASTDPVSGLALIAESALPPEARETLELIRAGGPYPYPRNDDKTFGNREGILPHRPSGYYREYTVETPGSDDRGARRIVSGDDGEHYYTDDHYQSFRRIQEGR
ncbi:MAG: ribonuclease [Actinomycetales bacterium]|nr:MAG: ribonuclease [Actinomycetales bacterium]